MAAALHYLGPNYRFETKFLVDGPIEDGVLKGNLYIKGSGDPALTAGDMDGITSALAEAGLRDITGNLILDDSFFDVRAAAAIALGKAGDVSVLPDLTSALADTHQQVSESAARRRDSFRAALQ